MSEYNKNQNRARHKRRTLQRQFQRVRDEQARHKLYLKEKASRER